MDSTLANAPPRYVKISQVVLLKDGGTDKQTCSTGNITSLVEVIRSTLVESITLGVLQLHLVS